MIPLLETPPPSGGYTLGRIPLAEAIAQVTETLLHLYQKQNAARLVHAVQNKPDTLADWIPEYQKRLATRSVAPETLKETGRKLAKIGAALGGQRIDAIGTRDIADFLAGYQDTPRMQQAMRSLLLDVFRESQAAGWRADNPVTATRSERVQTQRGRLSLEAFQAIHAYALQHLPAWSVRAMELALVTGQRRGDIATMAFSQVKDGHLWVKQGKTGAKVAIPLTLRLEALGWTVGEIVSKCRDAVISRNLVHHTTHAGRAQPGDKVRDMSLGQAFAEARDGAGVTVAGKTPPTFHEIQSLAARLYDAQGVNAQALLGHKSADMTALYRDARGDEWVKVATK